MRLLSTWWRCWTGHSLLGFFGLFLLLNLVCLKVRGQSPAAVPRNAIVSERRRGEQMHHVTLGCWESLERPVKKTSVLQSKRPVAAQCAYCVLLGI